MCAWGEVFPRWIPRLGGRRVPVLGAVIPAGIGAILLTAILGPYELTMAALGRSIDGQPHPVEMHGWQNAAFRTCYAPPVGVGSSPARVTSPPRTSLARVIRRHRDATRFEA